MMHNLPYGYGYGDAKSSGETSILGAHFEGTNTYVDYPLSGLTDGNQIILAWKHNQRSAAPGTQWLLDNSLESMFIQFGNTGKNLIIQFENSAGTDILLMNDADAYADDSDDHITLLSGTTDGANSFQLYVDDIENALNYTTDNAGDIDFTNTTTRVGARINGTLKLNSDLRWFYLETNATIDLSVQANRDKFNLLDTSSDGSEVGSPDLFSNGVFTQWQINKGSEANGVVTGALEEPVSN